MVGGRRLDGIGPPIPSSSTGFASPAARSASSPVNGTVNDLALRGGGASAITAGSSSRGSSTRSCARREVEALAAAAGAGRVGVMAGDAKVVNAATANSMYVCTRGVGPGRRAGGAAPTWAGKTTDPDPSCRGPIGEHRTHEYSAHTRRVRARRGWAAPEHGARSPMPRHPDRTSGQRPALHAGRDARRARSACALGRAGARVGRRDVGARSRRHGAARRGRRGRTAWHRPDVCRKRGKARRLRRTRIGRCSASRAPCRAGPRGGGRDRRGEGRTAGDGPRGDGLRWKASDGSPGRGTHCRGSFGYALWRLPSSFRTSTEPRRCEAHVILDDHQPYIATETDGHDLGREPQPRGHHHPGDSQREGHRGKPVLAYKNRA